MKGKLRTLYDESVNGAIIRDHELKRALLDLKEKTFYF
jgi:hypothetical protein